jgi:hypothetical protein
VLNVRAGFAGFGDEADRTRQGFTAMSPSVTATLRMLRSSR